MSHYDREGGRSNNTSDPKMLDSRVFIGNLPSDKVTRLEVEKLFSPFGKLLGVSLHKSYGFVQYEKEEEAKKAVTAMHGHHLHGLNLDVNLAAERRKEKSKSDDKDDKSRHKSSSDSSRSHHSSSSRRDHRDDHHRSSRHRDRSRERDRDRDRYRRERSFSPPHFAQEMEYRARLRHLERMRGMPPGFRDPYFDPLGLPPLPPRDPYGPPRDYDLLPPRPYGPPLPMYDRMGPPPHGALPPPPPPPPGPPGMSRDPLYDRPPRPLTPPMERRDRGLLDVDRPPLMDRAPERDGLMDRGLGLERERPVGGSGGGGGGGGGVGGAGIGMERGGADRRMDRLDRVDRADKIPDMEIIVVNRQQKDYADQIRMRVEYLRLIVNTVQLSPTVSLADALDAAANRGLLYAMIVTSQHELHRSVTLTILHGRNPQEHKNMPLDDALGLVDRDFDRYMRDVREGRIPPRRPAIAPRKNDVSDLLSQAASGDQLTPGQLQQVIEALQKQKQHNEPPPPVVPQLPAKEDIQRQQADLQAKILSLLGSNAVVPPSPNQQSLASQGGGGRGYNQGSVGGGGGGGGLGARGGQGGGQFGGRGFGLGATGGGGGGRGFGQGGYGSGY